MRLCRPEKALSGSGTCPPTQAASMLGFEHQCLVMMLKEVISRKTNRHEQMHGPLYQMNQRLLSSKACASSTLAITVCRALTCFTVCMHYGAGDATQTAASQRRAVKCFRSLSLQWLMCLIDSLSMNIQLMAFAQKFEMVTLVPRTADIL